MAKRSTARPAIKPVRAAAVSGVRKTPVKKTPVKQAAKKVATKTARKAASKAVAKAATAPSEKPAAMISVIEKRRLALKRKAVLDARKTKETTLHRLGGDEPEPVIADDDVVARQKIARLRRTAVDKVNDPPPAAGVALVERVTRAVERELMQIETIVGGHHVNPGQRTEAERRARTLASLARTLAEVRRLRAAEEPQRPADGPSAARDLDAFRKILWKRLEGRVGRNTPFPADVDESGGNG
jgi:hypothetical protein